MWPFVFSSASKRCFPMLDKFRELSKTWLAKLLLALITIPFALFGIQYYFHQGGGGADVVVTVDGTGITRAEFNDNLRDQIDRMQAGLQGARIDPALLDSPQMRYQALDGLINRYLLTAYADAHHLSVPDSMLAKEISQFSAFQEDGKFSQNRYEGLLRERGLTPAIFEERVRDDLKVQFEQEALTSTGWVPGVSLDAFLKLDDQSRDMALVEIPVERFMPQVHVEQAQVQQYYEAHQEQFRVPERIRVQYLVLSANLLEQQVTVTPEEVAKAYADPANQARWQGPETRRARHILIPLPAKASEAQRSEAQAQAQSILKEANAHPERFEALARQYSRDPGSAAQGGDLGYFGRGTMTRPFENAVFAMKPGEISGPVESEFGFHVIQLVDVKAAKGKSLAEAAPVITQELRKQQAARLFGEAAENFSNLVYERSEDLKAAAEKFKLPIQTSGWITRGGPTEVPLLANPKLQAALFAPESLKEGRNTPAIEVAANTLVAGHVAGHEPSFVRPLPEVGAGILQTLQHDAAVKLAQQAGEARLADLQSGKTVDLPWSKDRQFTRQTALSSGLPPALVTAAFKANPSHLPAFAGAPLPTGTYALLRISQVTPGNPADVVKRKQAETGLARAYGDALLTGFLEGLRKDATIRFVNKSVLEPPKTP